MLQNEREISFTRVNLYEQIADYIEKRILLSSDEGWREGDKLPGEQELADSFGVSRNVIRETIKVLKERGLVESRNGVGATITKPDPGRVGATIYRYVLLEDVSTQDVYDVRCLLEVYGVQLAAQRIDEEGIGRLEALLEKMSDRSLSIQDRRETDFMFHVEIARASGNRMLEILMGTMKDVFMAMMEKGVVMLGGIDDACVRHERIMEALRSHDPVSAADMMRTHIETSFEHVKAYEKEKKSKRT